MVTVLGTVSDDNLLASVRVGEKDLGGSHEKSVKIEETLELGAQQDSIQIVASDLAGNQSSGFVSLAPTPTPAGPQDTIDPQLLMPQKEMVFFTELATLEIRAEDNDKVAAIEIAGKQIHVEPSSQVFTRQRLALKEGENLIPVKITDLSGNVSEETIHAMKYSQAVKMIDARMALGLSPIEKEGTQVAAADRIPDKLTAALLERERFQITVSEPSGADATLQGKVHETADSIDIVVRMIDPETGSVMGIFDAFDKDKSDGNLQFLADVLAEKMENKFPVVEGTVVQAKRDTVLLNFGVESPLPRLARCIVYREGEVIKDPTSGEILGALTEELAEVKIRQSTQKLVQAKITEKFMPDAEIAVGDKVITK